MDPDDIFPDDAWTPMCDDPQNEQDVGRDDDNDDTDSNNDEDALMDQRREDYIRQNSDTPLGDNLGGE